MEILIILTMLVLGSAADSMGNGLIAMGIYAGMTLHFIMNFSHISPYMIILGTFLVSYEIVSNLRSNSRH